MRIGAHVSRRLFALAVLFAGAASAPAQTVVQFDGNIGTQAGPGTLEYRGGSAGLVSFGTPAAFGIPALPGGTATVMSFPAFQQTEGLLFKNGASPNGGGQYVNQYTFGFDVLFPTINWMAFYNAAGDNADGNDADFYMNPSGGVGTIGVYNGTIGPNTWNRIMVTVDLAAAGGPTMTKYVNGAQVGSQTLSSGVDARWSLFSANDSTTGTALFTEGDTSGVYTVPGYINSFFFQDRALGGGEVAALGGPTAAGFAAVPEPGALALLGATGAAAGLRRLRRRPAAA
ncbi:MAG TPA: PEP-CTERM sorting domain-containing protein [Gemmataceae bacterium]|jgi:hypothetical protein